MIVWRAVVVGFAALSRPGSAGQPACAAFRAPLRRLDAAVLGFAGLVAWGLARSLRPSSRAAMPPASAQRTADGEFTSFVYEL